MTERGTSGGMENASPCISSEDSGFRKTTWDDRNTDQREYTLSSSTLEHPSSIVWWFDCPWCGGEIKAYLWSLSGGGKRCDCGAIFGADGRGFKRLPNMGLCGPNK